MVIKPFYAYLNDCCHFHFAAHPNPLFYICAHDRMDNQEYAVESIVEPWGYSQHFGDPKILLHMDVSSLFKVEDDSDEKKIKVEDKIFMATAQQKRFSNRYRF